MKKTTTKRRSSAALACGARIAGLRKAAGLSQAALGRALRDDIMTVNRWENGRSMPSTGALLRLALRFGVTVDHLLGSDVAAPAKRSARAAR